MHPGYRIGAYTFGGVRDLIHDRAWQLGLGADVTFYSKPAVLDSAYGDHPVSFQIFLRMRPGQLGSTASPENRENSIVEAGFRRRISSICPRQYPGQNMIAIALKMPSRHCDGAVGDAGQHRALRDRGRIAGPVPRGMDPTLSYLFATLSVAIVGAILVVRRTLVLRAAESLASRPEDA